MSGLPAEPGRLMARHKVTITGPVVRLRMGDDGRPLALCNAPGQQSAPSVESYAGPDVFAGIQPTSCIDSATPVTALRRNPPSFGWDPYGGE
jgi:hypothetical protein